MEPKSSASDPMQYDMVVHDVSSSSSVRCDDSAVLVFFFDCNSSEDTSNGMDSALNTELDPVMVLTLHPSWSLV